jgi:hypothetical protein
MAAQVSSQDWLEWAAKLMRSTATSNEAASWMSRDNFCCLLDEQPTHLVPQQLLRQAQTNPGGEELSFNPDCRLSSESSTDRLDAGAGLLATSAPAGGSIAWVRDRAIDTDAPFWLGPRLSRLVQTLEHEPAAILNVSQNVRALLCTAQILVPPGYADRRCQTWSAVTQQCRAKFRQNGYAPVAGLIHPLHLAALRQLYRRQVRKGMIRLGDDQSSRRYIAHNEAAARFFHLQLTKIVSRLVGEPVKPSYVYTAAYQAGARLKKHTDREQCEFSISLCVDYSPEPATATPWPLHLDTPRGTVAVYQALGDVLLYRGRDLPHYRGTLAEGNSSTSIFFHYVAEDFSGSLE